MQSAFRAQAAVPLVSALLLLPAVSARAQEGGSRSLFAQGVGNRALAMGGSFVALSDDASGILWNPGGLASISRLEFQGGQTRYGALGVSETYAMAALPNWRWGVAAASFRHMGADGIEVRDDRNFVTGGPISDSQSEIAFGYGRAMGELWNVGGALRARRQSLGAFSANGFGLDLGVIGHPWRPDWISASGGDISVGLALANMVRPSLRLDRESVSDPTTARAGLSWHHPLGGLRTLVIATDIEKPTGLSATFHGGAEVQLLPQFALRAGLSGRTMNAGSGFRWRDLSVDYAFENGELETVHRVGVSYAFGRTVTESRAAADRAEEEKLQSKLNEGFQKRQSEQVTALLSRAQERLEAGSIDEAIELLSSVATLDSGRADVAALQGQSYRRRAERLEASLDYAGAAVAFGRAVALAPSDTAARAGLARAQATIDRRTLRSTEARRQFAIALDAFGTDNLVSARRAFMRVLEIEPLDQDAAAMLNRTQDAIAQRVQGLVSEAGRSMDAGRLDDAANLLDQAATFDPQAEGLRALRSALTRARAADQAARASAARDSVRSRGTKQERPSAPKLSAKELDLLYRRGLSAMQERHSDEALRYWDIVWSADPSYARVADYLKRECLTRGMEAFAAGRLDEAAGFWRRALRVDPNDQRTIGYLQRAQQQLSRTREILGGN